MKKRLLSLALCLALCLGLLPVGVLAADSGGVYIPSTSTGGGVYEPTDGEEAKTLEDTGVKYIGADGSEQTCNEFTEITEAPDSLPTGWYVVKGKVDVTTHNLYASGTVNLILCDGAELNLPYGLYLTGISNLNIYGQGGGTGKLIARGSGGLTAIGLSNNPGNHQAEIRICGGTIIAQAESGVQAIGKSTSSTGYIMVTRSRNIKCVKTDAPDTPYNCGNTDGTSVTISKCTDHVYNYQIDGDYHFKRCDLCGTMAPDGGSQPHTYTDWTPAKDGVNHIGTCVCGATTTKAHTLAIQPNADGLTHSQTCSKCGYKGETEPHSYTEQEEYSYKWKKCSCGARLAAEYNGTKYASLQAAVDAAAKDSGTVTLAQNVPESVKVSGGSVTIDLSGHEWGSDDTFNDTLTVTGGSVTLQNGTLGRSGSRALFLSGGEVKIGENMTLWGHYGSVSTNPAIAVQNTEAKLTLGKDTKLIYGMKVPEGKTLSDYLLNGAMFVKCNFDDNSNLKITDQFVPNAYTINEYIDHIAIIEHTHSFDDNDYICSCGAKAVASVTKSDNVTYYTDLAEAIANADGGTVTMLNDVTVTSPIRATSDFTLDLNGKTITGGSNVASIFLIYGNVVVCDNSNDKMGLVIGTSSSSGNGNFNLQDGKLTIKSGTFNSSNLTAAVYANTGELIIESGTFNGEVTSYAPTSISGGTFQYLYTNYAIADLLKDGYGFKKDGNWLSATELGNLSVRNVTVAEAPLNGITVTSAKDIYSYGETVTLKAEMSNASSSVSYHWYKLQSNTTVNSNSSVDSIDNSSSTTCVLTDLLPNFRDIFGYYRKYVYYCAATCDGYTTGRSVQFTVEKADLRKANVEVNCLTYNGSEQSPTVKVTLDGKTLTENTDYTVNVMPQTNAGSYQLTIKGDGNYTGTKTVEWKILPKTIANPTIDVSTITYNGQAQTPSVTVKDGATIIPDTQYTVSYQDNTNAGTATVTVVSTSNSNYKFGPTEQAFTITKADAPTVTPGKLTVVNNHEGTYTYDLKQLLPTAPNGTYGNINWNGGYQGSFTISGFNYVANYSIDDDGILTINTLNIESTATGQVGTITITVITDNYENISLPIEVFAENKILPELDGTVSLNKTAITFGESLDTITISGTMKDGDTTVEGTFSWAASKELYPAGTHEVEWMFIPTNSGKYAVATGKVTITVNKATPTGKPEYTAITTSGKKLSDASLTQTETSFSVPGTVAWNLPADTEVTANTAYTWKFTPQDEQNYNDLTGTITLWHKSSSGSSSGSVTPGTKTDTVKNPDGSTTKTETKADGSKTETTTASSGGGSTGTTVTKTDAKGNTTTEASAKLSDRDVKEAQEKGEAVTVPVKGIAAAKDANAATKIKIDVPNNANKTTVEIPVENVTSGTVAVIVHEDGTEELVKDSKPTEHGVQLELSGSTTVKIIDNSKTFDDTKDHWSRDEVNFVAARELFNGVGGNQFGVSQPMTRGMVNTVLARLADVDTTPGQGQAWYEVGTDWAKKNGISDGTNPTAPVTREQLATLLYRYAGSPSVSGTLHAADAASVSDYAEDALLWANQNGIVNGVGSNTIAPKDNAQRAQVAAMLARYLQNQ